MSQADQDTIDVESESLRHAFIRPFQVAAVRASIVVPKHRHMWHCCTPQAFTISEIHILAWLPCRLVRFRRKYQNGQSIIARCRALDGHIDADNFADVANAVSRDGRCRRSYSIIGNKHPWQDKRLRCKWYPM